ncbi:uncharacterized protein LOC111347178 isoform X2 [Stylophora pistillata]|uniref:uncharacterized protein LOC111347178 isoform X2 n=1 Tax=Stylophora pistillata TaxID=50429 RepID=UPI000C049279|nr:uncharacterized protein LOC111347178 isoform X2 [Stylophora pistillata]
MMNAEMVYVLIVLGVDLLLLRTDGQRLCSCYTFSKNQWVWKKARDNCKSNNKILAVLESEQEWQFITNEIQNKTGTLNGEWFIGLKQNLTTQRWNWINGKPLTIDKWHNRGLNPDPKDSYGVIHEEYPSVFKGSLGTVRSDQPRGWICEEETATCKGTCFDHPVPTSTSFRGTSTRTKAVTTQGKTSTQQDITAVSLLLTDKGSSTSTLPVVTNVSDLNCKSDNDYFTLYLTIATLAGMLFIVSIILFGVLRLQRKKQQQTDSRNKAFIGNQHDFEESFPLNALNTSEDDGSRTYTSLVKSTEEDSDIEYENQISAPEYVNA